MTLQFNVLVIGGGIVGLTAALAMAARGYSVAILDAGSLKIDDLVPDVRVYAMNYASQQLLTQLDVWPHLDKTGIAPYQQMYVWDALNKSHIDFDSRQVGSQSLGSIIEESVLKRALLQQISLQSSIHLFSDCSVDNVFCDLNGVKVSSNQQTWEAQLLMIADGANSPTREKLKVSLNRWSYDQHAVVASVAVEKAHKSTAYQVFHPEGPLAFLPLSDSHQCSIVWTTTPTQAEKLLSLNETEFNETLTTAFNKKLGQVKLLSTRHKFPLQMRHVKQYTGTRWLLLGDAAHTIHPLAGLGLNVGLADIRSWLRCLDAAPHTLVAQKTLGAYQRERKNAVWQIILMMEGFKQLFSNSLTPLVALRGLGLSFCNHLTPLKRLFIEHAQSID